MTSKLAMPVVLIARLSLAKVPAAAAVMVTWKPASSRPSMPWEALASSPRNSAGFWASSCTWPVNVVSTPKLVRRITGCSEYSRELMVSA